MTPRAAALALVLAAFTAYSLVVVATSPHGYAGFVVLALRERWAMQMLLDLAIVCVLYSAHMARDARREGIPAWPYLVVTLLLGSIGPLAYLLHRELRAPRRGAAPSAAA